MNRSSVLRTDILAPAGAGAIAQACADAVSARLVGCGHADTAHPDARTGAGLLQEWEDFLAETRQSTRYNGARRFQARAAAVAAGAKDDWGEPVAALFSDTGVRALIRGTAQARGPWYGARRLSGLLPPLQCLSIPESGIVLGDQVAALDAVRRHLGALLDRGAVDRIDILNVPTDSALHAALARDLGGRFRVVSNGHVRHLRQLRDPGSGAPIQQNSAKTRQSLRRKLRNLSDAFGGAFEFLRFDAPESTDRFVALAAEVTAHTYQVALNVGVKDDAPTRALARELAAEGLFRGYVFLGAGRPIAHVMGDLECGTFRLWATSFLPEWGRFSPGILLLDRVFDDLAEEGAERFDFGHGDAAYKRLLSTGSQAEADLTLYGPGKAAALAWAVHCVTVRCKSLLRQAAARWGVLDWLRKAGRGALRRMG